MADMSTTEAHQDFGELLERVSAGNERVLLRRDDQPIAAMVPVEDYEMLERIKAAGQEWFWTERWQQMEREADEDYAAGRYKTFDNVDDFLADLDAAVKEHEEG